MNTALTAPPLSLTASTLTTLRLPAGAPCQTLHLAPGELGLLQVRQGRLWLTQDGCPDDWVLGEAQTHPLRGPATYRLSAWSRDCDLAWVGWGQNP